MAIYEDVIRILPLGYPPVFFCGFANWYRWPIQFDDFLHLRMVIAHCELLNYPRVAAGNQT